jgi:predicted chitinase
MAGSLDAKTVKKAFVPHVQRNVDRYYHMIDKAFDDYIANTNIKDSKGNKLVFSDEDIKALKTYAWATIATENDKCQPQDEDVGPLNTLMFSQLKLVKTKLVKIYERAIPQDDGSYHLIGNDFGRYDDRKILGNSHYGEGATFRGRGFIQLTGRDNYRRYAALAGIPDLESNPDLASDPNNAAKILAAYILHNSTRILDALNKNDLVKAREVVNGKNKKGALPNGYKEFKRAYNKINEPTPVSHPASGVPIRKG